MVPLWEGCVILTAVKYPGSESYRRCCVRVGAPHFLCTNTATPARHGVLGPGVFCFFERVLGLGSELKKPT